MQCKNVLPVSRADTWTIVPHKKIKAVGLQADFTFRPIALHPVDGIVDQVYERWVNQRRIAVQRALAKLFGRFETDSVALKSLRKEPLKKLKDLLTGNPNLRVMRSTI